MISTLPSSLSSLFLSKMIFKGEEVFLLFHFAFYVSSYVRWWVYYTYIKVSCLNRNRPKRARERERVNLFKIIHVYVFLLLKGRRTALLLKCAFRMCKCHENESEGKEDVEGRMRRCCNYTKMIFTQKHVVFPLECHRKNIQWETGKATLHAAMITFSFSKSQLITSLRFGSIGRAN